MCARNPASPVAWLGCSGGQWGGLENSLERSSSSSGHRVCGRVFAGFSVVSFYGNAQFAEPSVLFQVLQTARAFGRPCLLIGDFNWKPAYQCALDAAGAVMLPFTASVHGWPLPAGVCVLKGSSGMPRAAPLLCPACPITKQCVSPGLGPRLFASNSQGCCPFRACTSCP